MLKNKTLTITYHASHNHGSMLQAYALQQTLLGLGCDNKIINFSSAEQRKIMRVFSYRFALIPFLKDLSNLCFYRGLKKRHDLYNAFKKNYLKLTEKEYTTLDALKEGHLEADLFIAGSDQIWNPLPSDFDWAYYLPFVKGKKISYAACSGSFGSLPKNTLNLIGEYAKDFDSISVRDNGTKEAIEAVTDREVQINIDPVFLLTSSDWLSKLPIEMNKRKYIFFYTVFADKEMIEMVKTVSAKTSLPVVVCNFSNLYDLFVPFTRQLAAGPIEFLNLLVNAEYVISSSFHGTAFAMIFHKKLISIRGLKDNRINYLLRQMSMEDCSINSVTEIDNVLQKKETNWQLVDEVINTERQFSFDYLKRCIYESGE